MSICSIPKKPHRKPIPKAVEDSGSKNNDASFNLSLSRASLKTSRSSETEGYRPAKTFGWIVLKPGKADRLGLVLLVMVSPTGAPKISLIPAIKNPTSPAERHSLFYILGVNTPIELTVYS